MAKRGAFSRETVETVIARSGGICEVCGKARVGEIHHRIPRGMGGVKGDHASVVESAANALCLCSECHRWAERGDRAEAKDRGIILKRNANPELTPVLTFRGWRLHDSHGGVHDVLGS